MASQLASRSLFYLLLISAITLESAQQSVSHFGGSDYYSPGYGAVGALSKYNAATKHYEPVTWDKQYTYYRIRVNLNETFADAFVPDPKSPVVISIVISGDVFDNSTGVKVGTFDSFSITTAVTAKRETQYLTTMSVELGPNGDDTMFFQSALDRQNLPGEPNQPPVEFDGAITGGTGRYKGATGEVQHFGTAVTEPDSDNLYVAEVAVPRFKRF